MPNLSSSIAMDNPTGPPPTIITEVCSMSFMAVAPVPRLFWRMGSRSANSTPVWMQKFAGLPIWRSKASGFKRFGLADDGLPVEGVDVVDHVVSEELMRIADLGGQLRIADRL